jgi:peptidoglycan/LPS O-acetylase OafA/YrhL
MIVAAANGRDMDRDPGIDMIKGAAIVFVVVYHSIEHDLGTYTYFDLLVTQVLPVFMLLAGYNAAISFRRRGAETLAAMSGASYFSRRLSRLLAPFLAVWAFEVLVLAVFSREGIDVGEVLYSLVTGGYGPGSYFVPVMLQVVVILPFLYALSARYLKLSVALMLGLNVLLELAAYFLDMSPVIYRLLVIRYIFAVSLGIYLALAEKRSRLFLILGSIAGLAYIQLLKSGAVGFVRELEWNVHKAPVYVLDLAVVAALLGLLPGIAGTRPARLIQLTGRASYHVYLVQMAYFYFLATFTGLRVRGDHAFILPNVIVCCAAGVLFHALDSGMRGMIRSIRG